MNNIELFVNDTLIDFKSTTGLPFSVADIIDDLNEIGVMKSNKLLNFSDTIIIPATKINKTVLGDSAVKTLKVIKDSQQLFSSKIKVVGTNYKNSKVESFSCQVFGGNGDLVSILNDVSLRDLVLGFETWDSTNILASRTGTCSNFKGIFAPVIYGKLVSDSDNIAELDMRLHVYFDVIMRGIASKLNVSLVSNFFDTCNLWRRAVNVFGVGDAMQLNIANLQNYGGTTTGVNATSLQVAITNGGNFVVTVKAPSGGDLDIVHIHMTSSNGYDLTASYAVTTGADFITASIVIPSSGWFRIEAHGIGHSEEKLPVGSQISAVMQPLPAVGNEISAASTLHDESIVTWLKSQFQKFNLVSYYDSILKIWYIEPRFDYLSDGVKQNGFYTSISAGDFSEIDIDNTQYQSETRYKFGKIRFKYKEVEIFQNGLQGVNILSIVPNSTETVLNNQEEVLSIEDVFYHNAVEVTSVVSNSGLISALPSSFSIEDSLPVATFENKPVCCIISNDNSVLNYKGSQTTFPKLIQTLNSNTAPLRTFSYCNVIRTTGTAFVASGFVALFYQKWLSSVKRYKVLKGNCNIQTINEKTNFTKVYSDKDETYLLNSINDFSVEERKLTPCDFFHVSNVYSTDLDDTVHNAVLTTFAVT